MTPEDARRYRAAVARVVYMAQDRIDLALTACELAKSMANPKVGDETRIKRVGRYLSERQVYSQMFHLQDETEKISLWSDSDWATCQTSRRSNSGGIVFLGSHVVSFWCRTQPRIALSSAEAELYASLKVLSEGVGVLNMLREIHGERWGTMDHNVDASACRSIILRRGVGSIKHLSLKVLWVQSIVREHEIKVNRVDRQVNVAHVLCSVPKASDYERLLPDIGVSMWSSP